MFLFSFVGFIKNQRNPAGYSGFLGYQSIRKVSK